MSHRLVSNSSVMYNAQTQESSVLTIAAKQVNFIDNDNFGPGNNQEIHRVQLASTLYANFSSETQTFLGNINYQITDSDWNTFYNTQTFQSTSSYDKNMECGLLFIKNNLEPMFGLTKDNWTLVL